ncbi:MAG: hypothetical protein EZS28_046635, partial [Streblomastix strix]
MNFDQEVQPDVAQADEEITRKILFIAQKIPNCSVQEQTALLIKLVDIVSFVFKFFVGENSVKFASMKTLCLNGKLNS